jgi:FixJ family two-component response regulator
LLTSNLRFQAPLVRSTILMSGHSDTQLSDRAQDAGIMDLLRKPLARRDIAEPVARALQAGNSRVSN